MFFHVKKFLLRGVTKLIFMKIVKMRIMRGWLMEGIIIIIWRIRNNFSNVVLLFCWVYNWHLSTDLHKTRFWNLVGNSGREFFFCCDHHNWKWYFYDIWYILCIFFFMTLKTSRWRKFIIEWKTIDKLHNLFNNNLWEFLGEGSH